EAEHAVVEAGRVDAAPRQLTPRHVGRKFNAVQVRKAALPARERRAPVSAIGDFGLEDHELVLRFHFPGFLPRPVALMKARRACSRCWCIAAAAASPLPAANAVVMRLRPRSTTVRTVASSRVSALICCK